MNPVLLPLVSPELQHVALLDLMARSRTDPIDSETSGMDYKISRETNQRRKQEGAMDLPASVRRVLGDARAARLVHELVDSGALRLFVDADALLRRCELIERQWRDDFLLQRFVSAQASVPLIRRFFRNVTRSSVARLRRELGVSPPAKPKGLPRGQLDGLLDAWLALSTIDDPRERYLALYRHCAGVYSLATLFSAIHPDAGELPRHVFSSSRKDPHHV